MPTAKDALFGLASLLTLGHFITSSIIAADAINARDKWQLEAHGHVRRDLISSALGSLGSSTASAGPKPSDAQIGTFSQSSSLTDQAAQLPIFHSGLFRALVNGLAWLYFVFQ